MENVSFPIICISPTGHGLLDFNFTIIFILLINFSRWETAMERKGLQVSGRSQGVREVFLLGLEGFFSCSCCSVQPRWHQLEQRPGHIERGKTAIWTAAYFRQLMWVSSSQSQADACLFRAKHWHRLILNKTGICSCL